MSQAGSPPATASAPAQFTFGGNHYWFDNRNVRTNVQFMNIERSPVSSVFGFYVGGQKGNTVSVATSFFF